ncbi:MAG TPA: ABC transporter permease [Blastocatellia bacterium]|nr:ABC transporter permease [Blastocatellia bacterium]
MKNAGDSKPRPRGYIWLIKAISLFVPSRLRAEWKLEWQSEGEHRWALLDEWQRLNWRTKLDLLRRGAGALLDALWLQPYRWEDEMTQDLRCGFRSMLKNPGFTIFAVMSLALGIGANTAIFSLVDRELVRPLPYANPDQLYTVWAANPQKGIRRVLASLPEYYDWQSQNNVFDQMATLTIGRLTLTSGDVPESVLVEYVSDNFFNLLGRFPAQGRAFLPSDDKQGASGAAIISYRLWQGRFAGASDIIGKQVIFGDKPYTIIGVMAADFRSPIYTASDLFLTSSADPDLLNARASRRLLVLGRLKQEVTESQALSQMNAIEERIGAQNSGTGAGWGIKLFSLKEELTGDIRTELLILMGAVGFVLLIACTNVAMLLLTRGKKRRKEMAVRAALGAGRFRLIRQLLTESALLAGIGGAIGLLLAWLTLKPLMLMLSVLIADTNDVSIDGRILFFTLIVSILTGVAFGILPAIIASRTDISGSLKDSSSGGFYGLRHNWAGNTLVVVEVCLTLVLLVGSGLMVKTFLGLRSADQGFDSSTKLTLSFNLQKPRYTSEPQYTNFFYDLLSRLEKLPNVQSVAATTSLPLTGSVGVVYFSIGGRPEVNEQKPRAFYSVVTPNYFQVMGTPIISGRSFSASDNKASQPVFIIGQEMSRRYWPNENPIGKQITFNDGKKQLIGVIVGVVGDERIIWSDTKARLQIYASFDQLPTSYFSFVLQTQNDPIKLASNVRQQVREIDKDQPIADLKTMDQVVADSVALPRDYALLMAIFSGIALILAIVGIYGVISYSVSQRTHEISIRMALGAKPLNVIRLIVQQGLWLIIIGLALGIASSIALTRLMTSVLYGVSATDPLTFVIISLLMIFVALTACFIPALRATEVDPMMALKAE